MRPHKFALHSLPIVLLLYQPQSAVADVTLPNAFSDHAVLQRESPVAIWGSSDPGDIVKVTFDGQTKTATAGAGGKWKVTLDPMAAGGPFDLTASGKTTVTRHDILIGDVWICSGQSNMGTTLSGTQWWMSEAPGAANPRIRLLALGDNGGIKAGAPQADFPDRWHPCTPATAMGFSAVGYFLGKALQADLKVPIGLIKATSWGSPAEPFVPLDALRASPDFAPVAAQVDADTAAYQQTAPAKNADYAAKLQAYQTQLADFTKACDANDPGLAGNWAAPATDDSKWDTVRLPGNWEATGQKGLAGTFWLRRDTDAVRAWLGQDLRLELGGVHDSATVYFNGTAVGPYEADTDSEGLLIPANLVQLHHNVIALRVLNSTSAPGGVGSQDFLMYLTPADGGFCDERLPLMGDWKFAPGCTVPRATVPREPAAPLDPVARAAGCSYNGMIAPLTGYGIKGVVWYQGESNTDHPQEYKSLLPLLIDSWRKQWGQDFPFVIVQLPAFINEGQPKDYVAPAPDAPPSAYPIGWAALREAQLQTLAVPGTSLVVTLDLGDPWNIHPNTKRQVGERLAKVVLGAVYGQGLGWQSPLYKSMSLEGNKIRITFAGAEGGLASAGGPLRQFAIAGSDQKFVWANAKIAGSTVVVWNDAVPNPVAVRYAFSGDPEGANLTSAAGMPAAGFRTDNWDTVTRVPSAGPH